MLTVIVFAMFIFLAIVIGEVTKARRVKKNIKTAINSYRSGCKTWGIDPRDDSEHIIRITMEFCKDDNPWQYGEFFARVDNILAKMKAEREVVERRLHELES